MINRLPGSRPAAVALWAVLLAGLGVAMAVLLMGLRSPTSHDKTTLSVLRSEALAFLVTRRTTTQIVVEHFESQWSGEWRGVLWCTVSWRWGVDLKKVSSSDIRSQEDMTIVRLPEPELLDFAMSPGSVGFISKSTAVPKLLDFARGDFQRQLLEQKVRQRAMQFALDEQLLPSRSQIVQQLNETARLAELKIVFE